LLFRVVSVVQQTAEPARAVSNLAQHEAKRNAGWTVYTGTGAGFSRRHMCRRYSTPTIATPALVGDPGYGTRGHSREAYPPFRFAPRWANCTSALATRRGQNRPTTQTWPRAPSILVSESRRTRTGLLVIWGFITNGAYAVHHCVSLATPPSSSHHRIVKVVPLVDCPRNQNEPLETPYYEEVEPDG